MSIDLLFGNRFYVSRAPVRAEDGDRNEEIITVLMGFKFWYQDMNTTGIYINHGFSSSTFLPF